MFTGRFILRAIIGAAKARRRILFVFLSLAAATGLHAQDNPPGRVGRISYLKGKVSFLPAGQDQWSEATLNYVVTTGDHIYTDHGAKAEIEVGPYTVRLSEKTDLVITNLTDQVMQLGLDQGTMRLSVNQLPSGNAVEADTPNGSLTVLQEGTYRVDVNPDENSTVAVVSRGGLQITGGGVSQIVDSGQAVKLSGQSPIEVSPISMPTADSFDEWCEKRDKIISSSTSSEYVNTLTPGYEELDHYGRWVVEADYGPVWFPTVAVDWVPYRLGHWVWIGPWGWTWIEEEPWGFCPFHFGRWVHIGVAWGWLPGPILLAPIYAPAFVAFLGGPGISVSVGVNWVGWFPLGPAEPFFPWYYHTVDYLRIVNITNIRNVTNIENIINLNNIDRVHYAYRTVATTAVPPDVFRNGLPVAHHVVKIPTEQLTRAPIIPHPPVNPTVRAAMPGRPLASPPVRAVPRVALPRGAPAPVGETRHTTPPVAAGAPPHMVARPPVMTMPRLITRTAPPPRAVPFSVVRPALSAHPGRPLEPVQLENLRAGRPAGPMIGREFPPHVAAPVPAPRVAPPRHY